MHGQTRTTENLSCYTTRYTYLLATFIKSEKDTYIQDAHK